MAEENWNDFPVIDNNAAPQEAAADPWAAFPVAQQDTGQSYVGSVAASVGRGVANIGPSLVQGAVAFGDLVGLPTSGAEQAVADMEANINRAAPVNPIYQDTWGVKGGEAIGQAGAQLALALGTGGASSAAGLSTAAASSLSRSSLLGVAGLMGMGGGLETAEAYGINDPLKRAATILIGGAAEAGTEMIGGIGGAKMTSELLGEFPEAIGRYFLSKRAAKTIASEGGEEALSGAIQDVGVMALADEDVNRPGFAENGAQLPSLTSSDFYRDRLEEAALGAIGGTVFAGYQAAFNRPDTSQVQRWRQDATQRINELESNAETLTPQQQSELTELRAKDLEARSFMQSRGAEDLSNFITQNPANAADNLASYYEQRLSSTVNPEQRAQIEERINFWRNGENVRNLADLAQEYVDLNSQLEDATTDGMLPEQVAALEQQVISHPLHKDNQLSDDNQSRVMEAVRVFKAARMAVAEANAANNPAGVAAEQAADAVQGISPEIADNMRSMNDEINDQSVIDTFSSLMGSGRNMTPEQYQAMWANMMVGTPEQQQLQVDLANEQAVADNEAVARQQSFENLTSWDQFPEVTPENNAVQIETPEGLDENQQAGDSREMGEEISDQPEVAGESAQQEEERLGAAVSGAVDIQNQARQAISRTNENNAWMNKQTKKRFNQIQSQIEEAQASDPRVAEARVRQREAHAANPDADHFFISDAMREVKNEVIEGIRNAQESPAAQTSAAQARGVTRSAAQEGVRRLAGFVPNIEQSTWIGQASDLKNNAQFKGDFISEAKGLNPDFSDAQINDLYNSYVASPTSLAINLNGRNYVMIDNVTVSEGDQQKAQEHGGTAQEWAVARTLLHESWHTASQNIRQGDLADRFHALANRINESELDDLASRRYQEFADWRSDQFSKDRLVDEWMAERMEGVTIQTMPKPTSLLGRLLNLYREFYARVVGLSSNDVRDQDLLDMFEAWRTGGVNVRKRAVSQESTTVNEEVAEATEDTGAADEAPIPFIDRFEQALREDVAGDARFTEQRIRDLVNWVANNREGSAPWGSVRVNRIEEMVDADIARENAQIDAELEAEQESDNEFGRVPVQESRPQWDVWYNRQNQKTKQRIDAEVANQELAYAKGLGDAIGSGNAGLANQIRGDIRRDAIMDEMTRAAVSPVLASNPDRSDMELTNDPTVRRLAYEGMENNPNAPAGLKDMVQVVGRAVTRAAYIERVKVVAQYARQFVNSELSINADALEYGDTNPPPINAENTQRVRDLWNQLRAPDSGFAQDYLAAFRATMPVNSVGETVHKGGAAVGALQLELMDYAKRLAGTANFSGLVPGSSKYRAESAKLDLAKQMSEFANDIIIGDYMTISDAARAMQLRGMASGKQGFWQSLRLIREGIEAHATKNGDAQRVYDELDYAITDPAVTFDVPVGMEEWANSGAAKDIREALDSDPEKLAAVIEDRFISAAMEEAMGYLDQQNKQTLSDVLTDIQRLREIENAIALYNAQNPVQASAPVFKPVPNSLEQLIAERDALMQKIDKNLNKFRKQTGSKSRAPKTAKSAEQEAQALVAAMNKQRKANKKQPTAVKKALMDQIANPASEAEFSDTVSKLGVSGETASAMFEIAARKTKAAKDVLDARKAKAETSQAIRDAIALRKEQNAARKAFRQREAKALADIRRKEKIATDEAVREAKQLRKEQEARRKRFEDQEAKAKAKLDALLRRDETAPDREAKAIIDRLDVMNTEWVGPDSKKSEIQLIKEAALRDGRVSRQTLEGPSVNKTEFVNEYSALLQEAGVTETQSKILAGRLYGENLRLKSSSFTRFRQRSLDSAGFIRSLAESILNTTSSDQQNGDVRREWIKDAFMDRGLNEAEAEAATNAMDSQFKKRLDDAKIAALEKAAKQMEESRPQSTTPKEDRVTKNSVEALRRAIRADYFNPHNAVAVGLASAAGYNGLSDADYARLARLDELLQSSEVTEGSQYVSEMMNIVSRTRPPLAMLDIIAKSYVSTVLGGLSTQSMTWTSAFFTMITRGGISTAGVVRDVVSGKLNAEQALGSMGNIVASFIAPYKTAVADAAFSLKHDAYRSRMQVHLRQVESLHGEFEKARAELRKLSKSGFAKQPMATMRAMVRVAYTSTDLIRRSMSAADQVWGGMLREYTFNTEAFRELITTAKLSVADANMIMANARQVGLETANNRAKEIGRTEDMNLLTVMSRDYAMRAVVNQLEAFQPGLGEKTALTATTDSEVEIGTRRNEDAPAWDLPNRLVEVAKAASSITKRKSELLGHILTGFVTTPANLLDRSVYFTPWGLLRVYAKQKLLSQGAGDTMYSQTMATDQQMRIRQMESIAGTFGTIILYALMNMWKDEEDRPIIEVTGAGPTNRAQKEAWIKQGNTPNSIQLRLGDRMFKIPYARGGFENANISLAILGAESDMMINAPETPKLSAQYVGEYLNRSVVAVGSQATFLSPKNIFGAATDTMGSTKGMVGQLSFMGSSFIPFSQTIKTTERLIRGQQDTSSIASVVKAQIPIVASFTGNEAVNFLGDKVGPGSDSGIGDFGNRAWYAGVPVGSPSMTSGPRSDIYKFIFDTGIGPSFPNRRTLEQRNGFVEDKRWIAYVKLRGNLIVEGMRDRLPELRSITKAEAEKIVDRIASDSTKTAKERMNLK